MTNGNDAVHPSDAFIDQNAVIHPTQKGLTKREAFAMAAMQGLCANTAMVNQEQTVKGMAYLTDSAIAIADAQIAAINVQGPTYRRRRKWKSALKTGL